MLSVDCWDSKISQIDENCLILTICFHLESGNQGLSLINLIFGIFDKFAILY